MGDPSVGLLGRILDHWQLKLISLGFAVALWLFVVGEDKAERVFTAQVEFRNIPAGLELVGDVPDFVEVRVLGLRSRLNRVVDRDILAVLDLKYVKHGESTLRLVPEIVQVPRGLQVLRVNPSRVRVTLEASATGKVRVVPKLQGTPARGYRVSRVSVDPTEVEIRGPRSEVAKVKVVETEQVSVDGVRESVERESPLLGLPPQVRPIHRKEVAVRVEVVEEEATRRLANVPLQVRQGEWKARVAPESVEVTVKGPASRVQALSPTDILAEVDLRELAPKNYRLPPKVQVPSTVILVEVRPGRVQVLLQHRR